MNVLDSSAVFYFEDSEPCSVKDLHDFFAFKCSDQKLNFAVYQTSQKEALGALIYALANNLDLALLRHAVDESQLIDVGMSFLCNEKGVLDFHQRSHASTGRLILQTSGTTGEPKLVEYRLENLISRVAKIQAELFMNLSYSIYSFAGLQVFFTALINNSKICIPENPSVSTLASHPQFLNSNHISCTPSFFRALMVQAEKLPNFNYISFGGERIEQRLLDEVIAKFPNAKVAHIYASTEAGSLFAVKDGKEGFPKEWLNASGRKIELKIQDGTLRVKTAHKMNGYIGSTDSVEPNTEWLDTKDLVEIVNDRVVFKGRKNVTISIGGQKVSPEYIEAKLMDFKECVDCRVFAVPNAFLGSLVAAEVVLKGPKEESLKMLKSKAKKVLTKFEMPVKFNLVEKISLNELNKKSRTQGEV